MSCWIYALAVPKSPDATSPSTPAATAGVLYAENAQLYPPGLPVVQGRAGIAGALALLGALSNITLKNTSVDGRGDIAIGAPGYQSFGVGLVSVITGSPSGDTTPPTGSVSIAGGLSLMNYCAPVCAYAL